FRGGMKERFAPGRRFLLSGTPRRYKGGLQMAHPETALLDESDAGDRGAGIRVRYPEVEGVTGVLVARLCRHVAEAHAAEVPDGLPATIRRARGFPSQGQALARLHRVDDAESAAAIEALNRGEDVAQRRLAFDELFFLQVGLARRPAQA